MNRPEHEPALQPILAQISSMEAAYGRDLEQARREAANAERELATADVRMLELLGRSTPPPDDVQLAGSQT